MLFSQFILIFLPGTRQAPFVMLTHCLPFLSSLDMPKVAFLIFVPIQLGIGTPEAASTLNQERQQGGGWRKKETFVYRYLSWLKYVVNNW